MNSDGGGGFRKKRPASMGRHGHSEGGSEKASPTSRMRIRAVPILRLPQSDKKTKGGSIVLPPGVGHGEPIKEVEYVSFISSSKSASTASSARSDYNGGESESTPHSAHSAPMSPATTASSNSHRMKHHKSKENVIVCPMCDSSRKKVKLGMWPEYQSVVYYCGYEDRKTNILCGHVFMPSCPLVLTTRVVLFCESNGNRVEFQ
jgi:hypothetical protein